MCVCVCVCVCVCEQELMQLSTPAAPAECPYIGFSAQKSGNMLEAQTLWDATMAYSISQAALPLSHEAGGSGVGSAGEGAERGVAERGGDEGEALRPLVVHVCGKFHCENDLGIPEHLKRCVCRVRVCLCICVCLCLSVCLSVGALRPEVFPAYQAVAAGDSLIRP